METNPKIFRKEKNGLRRISLMMKKKEQGKKKS